MNEGFSLADVAAATRNDNDGFGGGGWWAIILFAMIFGWGRGGFGNQGPVPQTDAVTEAGLCNAMNFNNLENAVGRLNDQSQLQTAQLSNGICDLGYNQLGQFNNIEKTVMQGQYALSNQIADCCCKTQNSTKDLQYAMAQGFCGVEKTIDDRFAAMEKAALNARISDLERQNQNMFLMQQMQGVIRYPNGWTYDAGKSPFCPTTTTTTAA